jgi:arginine repressor
MKTYANKPTAKKSAPKKRKVKKRTPSNGAINKSQSIRDAFRELGKKTRPKDIIAALAEKGIKVASGQVSTVLRAAGLRRGRRRRKGVAVVAAPKHSANGQSSMIDELLKVKKLAKELGGTDKLKELVAALERLL